MYSLLEVMETKHLLKHLPTIFHMLFSYDVSYIFGEILKKNLIKSLGFSSAVIEEFLSDKFVANSTFP